MHRKPRRRARSPRPRRRTSSEASEAQPEAGEAQPEAATAESEEILDEEELAEAQRESIAAAVAARLAEEEAKSEEQQAEEAREREQMLGSALAGAAIGALLPAIGARLVGQEGDRVILQQDDRLVVRSDETRRFLAAGGESVVEELAEGRLRVTTTYPDGTRIVTLRDASGELVRRVRILPNGDEIVLFDEAEVTRLAADELPPIRRDQQRTYFLSRSSEADIAEALHARPLADIDRRYTIRQIREHEELRWLMPSLALDEVTFETDSAELGIDQVRALDDMGRALAEMIARDPDEVFLVEGHTDAVGSDVYNLALSDRRAETVATLLTEHYDVPPGEPRDPGLRRAGSQGADDGPVAGEPARRAPPHHAAPALSACGRRAQARAGRTTSGSRRLPDRAPALPAAPSASSRGCERFASLLPVCFCRGKTVRALHTGCADRETG
jgi:outer membrane protein OmpA-like peptidoglycan-associated protein